MADRTRTAAMKTTLSHWLRLLWNIAPPLHMNSDQPFIAAGSIHLPAQTRWQLHAAAAAHAAAHLVYSPRVFDGGGLGAIARTLMAVLEDARVEALAVRELPGLARLWRPLHVATPATGADFEALLQRLARVLADPSHDDPDPWVRKGCALFYGDARNGLSVLHTAADVRRAALRLGHDIGQMRLQFNAKTYRAAPAYRDDHRWMWAADVLSAAPPPALAPAGGTHEDDPAVALNESVTRYPEWDRLIARLRPDWCSVIEQATLRDETRATAIDNAELIRQTAVRLRRLLRALTHQRAAPQCSDEGELFDPGALVDWRVARRRHHATEPRVYRAIQTGRARAAVCLLIDQSASTADVRGADGHSVLQTAALSAAAMAQALDTAGVDCSIAGFSSNGRHAVRFVTVKTFGEPADHDMTARLQALRAGGSTRLGAALRHVTRSLARYGEGPRFVIVLSDGEPYDVDVHDPRYLIEDARQAVCAAARLAVRVICLAVTADRGSDARRIFGRAGVQRVHAIADVPQAFNRWMI